jgi:hypothetical protein
MSQKKETKTTKASDIITPQKWTLQDWQKLRINDRTAEEMLEGREEYRRIGFETDQANKRLPWRWCWWKFSKLELWSKCNDFGRAIAQAVSHWLPIAVVRGSRTGRHVGFYGGQSGAGAGFLRVLRFPLPNSFHQFSKKSSSSSVSQSINHRGYVQ